MCLKSELRTRYAGMETIQKLIVNGILVKRTT